MAEIKKRELLVLMIISLGITFSMCNPDRRKVERHSNIPEHAVWYGGIDGGVWITVSEYDSINTFAIKVYNENDGSLWNSGLYRLNKECSKEKLGYEEIRKQIEGYDGERILLRKINNGKYCSLEPLSSQ